MKNLSLDSLYTSLLHTPPRECAKKRRSPLLFFLFPLLLFVPLPPLLFVPLPPLKRRAPFHRLLRLCRNSILKVVPRPTSELLT